MIAAMIAGLVLAQTPPDCIGLKIREINLADEVTRLQSFNAHPSAIRAARLDYLKAHRDFVSQCFRRR